MSYKLKVSIIIINFNYAKYLPDAINSSINQTYKNVETIVIDDGSTDESREIIMQYEDTVIPVFQKNKGMMEASNTGFAKSTGEIILFLDADDYLYDYAVEKIVSRWRVGTSKIHFRLKEINSFGNTIGYFPPLTTKLGEGDCWKEIINYGFYTSATMSGNAFSRSALINIFPVKDAVIGNTNSYFDKIPTDAYLNLRVPFYGKVIAIEDPLGVYRIHGKNLGAKKNPMVNARKRKRVLRLSQMNAAFIKKQAENRGIPWHENNLFRNNNLLKYRILSFRLEKDTHPWQYDTAKGLLLISANNTFSQASCNGLRKLKNFLINLFILFAPRKTLNYVLKKKY